MERSRKERHISLSALFYSFVHEFEIPKFCAQKYWLCEIRAGKKGPKWRKWEFLIPSCGKMKKKQPTTKAMLYEPNNETNATNWKLIEITKCCIRKTVSFCVYAVWGGWKYVFMLHTRQIRWDYEKLSKTQSKKNPKNHKEYRINCSSASTTC